MPFGNMTITITYNSSLLYNQMDRLSSSGTYMYASIRQWCMFVWWCCKITLTIYWRKMFYILLELAKHQMGGGVWDNPFGCIANISILLKFHFLAFVKPCILTKKKIINDELHIRFCRTPPENHNGYDSFFNVSVWPFWLMVVMTIQYGMIGIQFFMDLK